MIPPRFGSGVVGLLAVLLVLGACGGDSAPAPTATAEPESTEVLDGPTTQEPADIVGSTATDGICQVTIPDTWVDDGTGRGATEQGDRWSVFGNAIASDEAWNTAKELLKAQLSGREGVTITEDERVITAELPDGRGYIVRQRFDDRYCEFAVTANDERIDEVTAIWLGVAETLAPRDAP